MQKMIDAGLLERSFVVVPQHDPGVRILSALEETPARYYVIGDHWKPGEYGILLRRTSFIEDVVDDAFEDAELRDAWHNLLLINPRLLPTVIAARIHHAQLALDPATAKPTRLDNAELRVINGYLRDYMQAGSRIDQLRAMVIDAKAAVPRTLHSNAIAVEGDQVIGIIEAENLPREATRLSVPRQSARPRAAPAAAAPAPPVAASTPAGPSPATTPFVAYPRLDVTEPARRKQEFSFQVGFSDTSDPDAEEIKRIRIEAPSDDEILVIATAEGARIVEPSNVVLKLDLAAQHEFKAIVDEQAARVCLRAQYFYRNRPVGHIVKLVPLEDVHASTTSLRGAGDETRTDDSFVATFSPELVHYAEIDDVDLVLLVQKRSDGNVTWKAYIPATRKVLGPFETPLGDTQSFARRLAGLRKMHGDKGAGALEELAGIGKEIAEHIPREIQESALAPAVVKGEPTILLMTDEPFVPWELARLGPPVFERPAFLGELAAIGRWWTGGSLGGPRSARSIKTISAVAATEYVSATMLFTLKHAVAERTWMIDRYKDKYKAREIEATLPLINAWLDTTPRPHGHLAHIALHGFSDVSADAQGLTLGDGKTLTPNRLAGEYFEGDTPRFEIIFLNACQVGTAGEGLGRIAGFPGATLRGGASAFIGPLWEVQDEIAQQFAQQFYALVLDEQEEVGAAMRKLRTSLALAGSISPWAYLYYGHPKLKLTRDP